MDIIPFSLGIERINFNPDPEIRKEGYIMEAIIKRWQKIPFIIIKTYQIFQDSEVGYHIIIYEGDKKYIKYNHILGKLRLYIS